MQRQRLLLVLQAQGQGVDEGTMMAQDGACRIKRATPSGVSLKVAPSFGAMIAHHDMGSEPEARADVVQSSTSDHGNRVSPTES